MGRCEKYREKITDLALGALPEAERADVEAHAAGCPECGALLEENREIFRILRSAELPEPGEKFSAGLADRIFQELKESGAAPGAGKVIPLRRGGAGVIKTLSALAAMLVLAVGFFYMVKNRGGQVAETPPPEQDTIETQLADVIEDMGIFNESGTSLEIDLGELDVEEEIPGDFNEMALALLVEDAGFEDGDLEWVESGLAAAEARGAEDEYTDFFDNISEEEAREILEGLEAADAAAPGGVS